jgi:amino acid permease
MSKFAAYITLVKGNVGPGCLVLPCAFAKAGIAASFIAIVIVTALAMLCPWLLIDAKEILQSHRVALLSGRPTETLEDLTLHALGRTGRRVSQAMTYFLQLGICCVFLHFCAENAASMVHFYKHPPNMTKHQHHQYVEEYFELEVKEWCIIFAMLALPISMGKSVAALAKFTIVATITFTIALSTIYYLTANWAVTIHLNQTTMKHDRLWWPLKSQSIVVAFADMVSLPLLLISSFWSC